MPLYTLSPSGDGSHDGHGSGVQNICSQEEVNTWLVYEGDLHHHLVYRGALSHIQWNVVFTFQRDYNHTVCESLVLINTQIYTNEV